MASEGAGPMKDANFGGRVPEKENWHPSNPPNVKVLISLSFWQGCNLSPLALFLWVGILPPGCTHRFSLVVVPTPISPVHRCLVSGRAAV
jgi:hypothetical protein